MQVFILALRQKAMDAAIKGVKLVLTFLVGAIIMLTGCGITSAAGTLVTLSAVTGIATRSGVGSGGSSNGGFDPNPGSIPLGGGSGFNATAPSIQLNAGFVSDADRYRLALAAGWTGENAIIAVAVSIAEDPTGDPTIEHVNRDGSIDKGLWQINSPSWAACGGRDALSDPATNAWCAHNMWVRGGWNQWCTYPGGCNGGPGAPNWATDLARARAVAGSLDTPVAGPASSQVFPIPGWTGTVQLHWGIAPGGSDLFAARGQPVVSVSAGTVLEAGFDSIGGNEVLIKGIDGLQYYYAHFNAPPSVRVGQQVSAGTQIGVVGNTGDAAGGLPHLHIGIGYSILLGKDATGGTGSGFDAVTLLRSLYAQSKTGG